MNFKFVFGLIVIGVLVVLLVVKFFDDKEIENNARFTIGYTKVTYRTAKAGESVYYEYNVRASKYSGSISLAKNDLLIVPNGRYYVVFSSKNPRKSKLLKYKPVSPEVQEYPKDGWGKLPE